MVKGLLLNVLNRIIRFHKLYMSKADPKPDRLFFRKNIDFHNSIMFVFLCFSGIYFMYLQRDKVTNETPSPFDEYRRLRTRKGQFTQQAAVNNYVSNYFYLM